MTEFLSVTAGKIEEVVLEARMVETGAGGYKKSDTYINGLPGYTVEIKEHIPVNTSVTFTDIHSIIFKNKRIKK